MANGFKHKSVDASLSQTEYEVEGTGHVFADQATGDIMYADSSTNLRRLAIGSTGDVLTITGGIPAWDTTWSPTGHIIPATDDTYDLGSASAAWQDLFLEGDITLTDAGTLATSAGALTITSAAAATWSTSAGALTLNGTGGVALQEGGAAIISISDARAITTANTASIALDATGVIELNSSGGALSIGNDNVDQTVNIATAGTRTLNIGIGDGTDVTTTVVKGTFTVGVDDTGYDVKFFGETASAYMLWDQSEDDLVLAGAAGLDVDGTSNLDNTDIDGTLVVDGTNISLDSTTTLNIDNSNTSNGITIGTATSGVPVSIGHATSETTVNDNLTVTGDLTVSGTTTTVDSTTVAVGDSMILLAKDQGTSADAVDFGIYGKYGESTVVKYAGIFRDLSATGDPWTFFDSLEAEPGTTVNTGGTGYDLADISAGAITSADGFTGDLTGNVTGNTSGTAATVTTAAQSNITSLGTLTTLTVDNVIVNGTTIGHTSDTDLLTLTSANLAVAGDIEVSGEVQTANIGYTDGDNSMTIADGGKVTFAAGFAVGSDAEGDVLYSNGTNYVRLARGSDADVLTLASGVPSWATPTTGDITGVTAGTGLSGGGSSGSVTLNVDAAQSQITTVGTIGTGVWQGTAIASGYIADAFLKNDANDTTTGTITAAGFTAAADGVVTLADEGKVKFTDDAPSTDHTATGVTVTITSSSTLARGVPVYINGSGTVTAADADAATSMPAIGINTTDLSGGAGEAEILLLGIWRDDTYNFAVGADVFIGLDPASSTANSDVLGITTTAPTAAGDTVQKVGVVLTADTVFVNFTGTEILLA